MRIITEPKLDFSDVLILPKRSTLTTRKDVSLNREYTMRNSHNTFSGIPIIVANMDSVGTMSMARALNNMDISVAIHKHYSIEKLIDFFGEYAGSRNFYSMGILDKDIEKFKQVYSSAIIKNVCIDVANGYTEKFVNFVKWFRDQYPSITIMAGNVVTGEMTEQLLLAGADIVKVGIGPGCLAAESRILMSNGVYKDIIDVKEGDRVINMHGRPATVKKSFSTGVRKVINVRTNSFHKKLTLTPDHKCFVGDVSSVSKTTLATEGYSTLNKNTRIGESKLKWKEIGECSTKETVALVPSEIIWELPHNFSYDISDLFIRDVYDHYNKTINSSYELGYIFGFFLGDGNINITINKTDRGNSTSGRVEWAIHKDDTALIVKLSQFITRVVGKEPKQYNENNVVNVVLHSKQWAHLFSEFGKRESKHLPEKYMCIDMEYNIGLYDGLMDSDGTYETPCNPNILSEVHVFTNTSTQILELYGILCHMIYGYFPSVSKPQLSKSDLVQNPLNFAHKMKHTNDGGQLIKRKLKSGEFVVKFMEFENNNIEIPVYDLEIDDDSHSFIANNMIVHNSVCTTRKVAGVGVPQLSAILECADAAHGLGGLICGDGGLVTPGDFGKGFGAGADFLMAGGIFAGHDECEGEFIYDQNSSGENRKPTHMKFYGMSSSSAMDKHNGGVADYRASEGKEVRVKYKGPVEETAKEILGGVRSTCTYTGSKSLKELSKRTTFILVNRTHNTTFGE